MVRFAKKARGWRQQVRVGVQPLSSASTSELPPLSWDFTAFTKTQRWVQEAIPRHQQPLHLRAIPHQFICQFHCPMPYFCVNTYPAWPQTKMQALLSAGLAKFVTIVCFLCAWPYPAPLFYFTLPALTPRFGFHSLISALTISLTYVMRGRHRACDLVYP